MKSIRVDLTDAEHHALRMEAASANQTMRHFAAAVLRRALGTASVASGDTSGPHPARTPQKARKFKGTQERSDSKDISEIA